MAVFLVVFVVGLTAVLWFRHSNDHGSYNERCSAPTWRGRDLHLYGKIRGPIRAAKRHEYGAAHKSND
jgi:hypothetical protein